MKRKFAVGSLLLSGAAALLGTRRTSNSRGLRASHVASATGSVELAHRYMMYFGMPAWGLAGALDWLWHRQTRIEYTSGPKESMMHLLMMVEGGIPVLGGLFLEPNSGLLALMSAGMLLHEATVIWDVEYTVSRRKIPAREQYTHTFMETIPLDILAVFACLHVDQFRAMLGLSDAKPDFSLRLRRPALPLSNIMGIFSAMTLFVALPHMEELWRCWRAYKAGRTGSETPQCARELYAA